MEDTMVYLFRHVVKRSLQHGLQILFAADCKMAQGNNPGANPGASADTAVATGGADSDADSDIEQQSVDVIIDRAFNDDF